MRYSIIETIVLINSFADASCVGMTNVKAITASHMPICVNVVEECDARDDDSSSAAGKQNKKAR